MKAFVSFLRNSFIPNLIFLSMLIFVFIALMYLSLQFIFALSGGFFNRWERLPNPPSTPVEIVPHYTLRVRDINQVAYDLKVFNPNSEERGQWLQVSEILTDTVPPLTSDCVAEALPWSLFSPPPTDLIDCQTLFYGPEVNTSYVVLDNHNQLWARIITMSTSGGLIFLVLFALGAFVLSPILTIALFRGGSRLLILWRKANGTQTT